MRVVLKSVKVKNFLSVGPYFLHIPLAESRTTLLCGKNGTGKSVLTDALCYGLFGRPFRDVNKPQLINSVTGKNALVEVELSRGSEDFRVVRGMRPSVFEIYRNGELVDQTSHAKDYQRWLEETVLRTNLKTFTQTVVIGSANFTPFMKLPAQQRRAVIEDLLDISIFSTMNQLLREKISYVREESRRVDERVAHLREMVETKRRHRERIQEIGESALREKRDELERIRGKISEARARHATISRAIYHEHARELDRLRRRRAKAESGVASLERRRRSLEKRRGHFESLDVCPTCEQKMSDDARREKLESVDAALRDVDEKLERVRGLLDAYDERIELVERADAEYRDLKEERIRVDNTISALQEACAEIASQIDEMERQKSLEGDDGLERDVAALERGERRSRALAYAREIYSDAQALLRDDGVKSRIIAEYVPMMNTLINHYLEKLDFFCEFYIDEEFKEHIRSKHRDDFSYSSFSEGQKMRIDLSLLFAWREVARLRNSSSFNLLVLDEVMDSSLDAEGTEEFLNLLFGLTGGDNVFIISHKTDTIIDKFDSVKYFDTSQNFTRMRDER